MKRTIILTLLALLIGATGAFAQKKKIVKVPEMYMYGVGYMLSDSTVYLTEIMPVKDAYEQKANKFLYARNEYSYEFRDYLQKTDVKDPMVAVAFNKKRAKLEKKFLKLKKKLSKDNVLIKYVPATEFSFHAIEYAEAE